MHRQIDVVVNGAPLPNNNNPGYLGVTLDRSLTYKKISKASRAKSTSGTASFASPCLQCRSTNIDMTMQSVGQGLLKCFVNTL